MADGAGCLHGGAAGSGMEEAGSVGLGTSFCASVCLRQIKNIKCNPNKISTCWRREYHCLSLLVGVMRGKDTPQTTPRRLSQPAAPLLTSALRESQQEEKQCNIRKNRPAHLLYPASHPISHHFFPLHVSYCCYRVVDSSPESSLPSAWCTEREKSIYVSDGKLAPSRFFYMLI